MKKTVKQVEQKEYQEVKYIRELTEYWSAYVSSVINEIFVGIGTTLGISENEAYKLIKNDPSKLEKAGFFKSIFEKFKNIFKYRVKKFRPKVKLFNKDGSVIDEKRWQKVQDDIHDFWVKQTQKNSEDMTLKGFILGKKTSKYREEKKKNFENKSFEQIDEEEYKNKMPSRIEEIYADLKPSERRTMNKALSRVAMHVADVENKVKSSIRKNVVQGLNAGKSPTQIASDLYWNVQGGSKQSADVLRRDWTRIAETEVQSIYEAGILAPHEEEARESIENQEKAQYFVYTGGTCKWCKSQQGTIVRLLPEDFIRDKNNDSLSSMGIDDDFTDIAVWIGKNNVGRYSYKEPYWQITTPAHPHGVATLHPIDFEKEFYNEKTGRVEDKLTQYSGIPKKKDFAFTPEEIENRKPHFVGDNRVMFNENLYERVSPDEYKSALKKWNDNPNLPIPVSAGTTSDRQIFEAAEKNRNDS